MERGWSLAVLVVKFSSRDSVLQRKEGAIYIFTKMRSSKVLNNHHVAVQRIHSRKETKKRFYLHFFFMSFLFIYQFIICIGCSLFRTGRANIQIEIEIYLLLPNRV